MQGVSDSKGKEDCLRRKKEPPKIKLERRANMSYQKRMVPSMKKRVV